MKILFPLLFLFCFIQVSAQVSSDSLVVKKEPESEIARNTIYGEVLGSGMYGSLNYDRIFFISNAKFSFRIGGFLIPDDYHGNFLGRY